MNDFSIPQLRLQNQHLTQPQFISPVEIVKWLGAVQAQDYGGAKWALAQRLNGATDDLIEKAFTSGDVIRTHVMRPTWHFVAPDDIRWMLDLTAARVQATAKSRHRQLELDEAVFTKCAHAITKAMEGGKQLERTEIATLFKTAGITIDEHRFVHIMMELELRKLVCSGGRHGRQFTYALLDERVPGTKMLSRTEALATLADRYFTAHGPATLSDYSWWSGLTIADAKAGLEMVKDKLENIVLNGVSYWHTGLTKPPQNKSDRAFLLPNYDEYIVSYKDRSSAIRKQDISKADPRGTIFNHTVVINGRVIGIWKHTFKANKVIVDIFPFRPLSKVAATAINTSAKRYARFLGMKEFSVSYHNN